jgi:hypothetical protein
MQRVFRAKCVAASSLRAKVCPHLGAFWHSQGPFQATALIFRLIIRVQSVLGTASERRLGTRRARAQVLGAFSFFFVLPIPRWTARRLLLQLVACGKPVFLLVMLGFLRDGVACGLYTRALSMHNRSTLPRMMGTFSWPESGLTSKLLSTYCALERESSRDLFFAVGLI